MRNYITSINKQRTLIDSEFYSQLSKLSWFIQNGYFARADNKYLHHFILPAKKGYEVDHINKNKLDNRKANLRYVTKAQNQWNRKKATRGIDLKDNKWRIRIQVNKKRVEVGRTNDFKEALLMRRNAERQYYGEFS